MRVYVVGRFGSISSGVIVFLDGFFKFLLSIGITSCISYLVLRQGAVPVSPKREFADTFRSSP